MDSYKHGGDSPCEMSGFRIAGLDWRKGLMLGTPGRYGCESWLVWVMQRLRNPMLVFSILGIFGLVGLKLVHSARGPRWWGPGMTYPIVACAS